MLYENLMNTRKDRLREPGVYYEVHHIVMKCKGGSNNSDNLVTLTAREHFIAHWLLWRIHRDRDSALAFSMMRRGRNRELISSRMYAEVREALSLSQTGKGNHMYGKKLTNEQLQKFNHKRPHTEETRRKISKTKIAQKFKHSEESKQKMASKSMGNTYALGHSYTPSNETRKKISIANTGKKKSDEEKEKMSQRAKTMWSTRDREVSEETRKKISAAFVGKICKILVCPKCGKVGNGNAMKRWHFDNCKV